MFSPRRGKPSSPRETRKPFFPSFISLWLPSGEFRKPLRLLSIICHFCCYSRNYHLFDLLQSIVQTPAFLLKLSFSLHIILLTVSFFPCSAINCSNSPFAITLRREMRYENLADWLRYGPLKKNSKRFVGLFLVLLPSSKLFRKPLTSLEVFRWKFRECVQIALMWKETFDLTLFHTLKPHEGALTSVASNPLKIPKQLQKSSESHIQ